MPLVKNVEKRIWDCEDFDVRITDGNHRDVHSNASLPVMYSCERMAKNNMTVDEWKRKRFALFYAGYNVDVLLATGAPAKGNSKLGTVRDSYSEAE